MKILLGINTLASIAQAAYSNHLQFFFKLGKSYPDLKLIVFHPNRMSIDRMRNSCGELALLNNCDYLLFIDDDVLVPMTYSNILQGLINCDADIAAGDVLIRGNGFPHMAFKKDGNGLKTIESYEEEDPSICDVDAVGFSLVLIKTEFLKKIPRPWFVSGPANTEDIYFCLKAREHVPDCKIVVNRTIQCAHIVGHEAVSLANRDAYNTFIKSMEIEPTKPTQDRGDDYLSSIKARLEVCS